MKNITLESCIIDGVNCVEVYICDIPPKKVDNPVQSTTIDISWKSSYDISKILKNYMQFKNTAEIAEFHYRDLCYSYDLANDGQRVTRRKFKKDTYTDACYALSFNEEVLPSHMFPCVKEHSNKVRIQRNSYRVNNRTYIIHDIDMFTKQETMYIRYNHSANVDLKKNEADFQRAYNTLLKRDFK
jgi:hypothetical protein